MGIFYRDLTVRWRLALKLDGITSKEVSLRDIDVPIARDQVDGRLEIVIGDGYRTLNFD